MNTSDPIGTILHLQRLSTEDGPGIRTTVFFKGCPLHCRWCHNPESISPRPQIQWLESRCIGCMTCVDECPQHAIARSNNGLIRDWTLCNGCGKCVEICPSGAQELLGVRQSASDLVAELLKDKVFFDKSRGGVTLSGGEPTLQPEFAAAVVRQLRMAGVSIALDTCGLCSWQTLEQLLPEIDVVLFDLKWLDPELHREWTGVRNDKILENLRKLSEYITQNENATSLWIRTPLIPNATLNRENLSLIGGYIKTNLDNIVERWELCAFNNLCRDKYRRLGLTWHFEDTPLLSQSELDEALQWALSSGIDSNLVSVTGAVKVEA